MFGMVHQSLVVDDVNRHVTIYGTRYSYMYQYHWGTKMLMVYA